MNNNKISKTLTKDLTLHITLITHILFITLVSGFEFVRDSMINIVKISEILKPTRLYVLSVTI